MGKIVPTLRRIRLPLCTFLILSWLFPSPKTKAAAPAQSDGGQAAATQLIVTVRDAAGATFSGLATVTLQHLDSSVLSTGTTMGGQAIFDGLGPGEYTVTVTAPGYVTATERLNFTHASESEQAYISL